MPRKPKPEDTAPIDTKTGDLLADVAPQPSSALATLPPAERAAVVLQSAKAEQELRLLVERTAAITTVVDAAGREETHRAAMTIKNARVTIEKTGKAAREDATAFSKAVIAEEKRLAAIIEAEEDRLFKLRDDFDAEQARIAKEEKEHNEARIAAIRAKIDAITALPREHAGADSAALKAVLLDLAAREVTEEEFAELAGEAELALKTTADALIALHTGALEREQAEAERVRKAEEERQRIEAEKEANRLAAARLAEQQAQAERARQEVEQAAAALKLAQEQQQRAMESVKALNELSAIEGDARSLFDALHYAKTWVFAPERMGAGAELVKMTLGVTVKTLEQRLAQAVAEERDAAHAEALEMNARLDAERDTERDAAAPISELPETGYITTNPDGSVKFHADSPALAAEPAPEPAPLPLPEAYSQVDEIIDAAISQGPDDFDLVEAFHDATRDLMNTRTADQIRALLEQFLEAVEA